MVTGLAHESRNLLQASLSGLERLTWRLQDRPEALEIVARVQRAQREMTRLFDDVRAYAAPLHMDWGPCHLAQVWREAWTEATAEAPGHEARLDEDRGGLDLWLNADPFRLRQVFRNLFDNALAATAGRAEPLTVTVTCRAANMDGAPALRVSVRDDGPGLTPEQRARLFEAFYTTKPKGSGLGMAIAQRIMDAHGGRIAVGEWPGPGAEFVLLLPRTQR
jgi:hypothetical protein